MEAKSTPERYSDGAAVREDFRRSGIFDRRRCRKKGFTEEKMKKTKVGFISLGCCKNQADTEVMLAELDKEGFEITADETEAEVIVVNTCAFIESAKQEAIDSILDVAWLKKHGKLKKLIVTGCLAERYRDEIFKEMPEVDAVLGVGSIHHICEAVRTVLDGKSYASYEDKNKVRLGGARIVTTPPYMAYIKIAEGCDNRCTYCSIPNIRGRFRSRPMEDIVEEAKLLCEAGAQEISLAAQDTTRYGEDLYGKYMLAELIRQICKNTDIRWIRLLYCYSDKITDELIEEMRTNERVVHYIDMPIQHINDGILKRMNRHDSRAVIEETIAKLRRKIPDIVIRTTAIVGFPGETEEQFEELCAFVEKVKFERFGAFKYSREEDTPAYGFDGQLDEQVKEDRYNTLMALAADICYEQNREKLEKTVTVLCEGWDEAAGAYVGRTYADAPDIDGKVFFDVDCRRGLHHEGDFVRVKITDFEDYDLIGVSV